MTTNVPGTDKEKRSSTVVETEVTTSTESAEEAKAEESTAAAEGTEQAAGGKPVIKPDNWNNT